MKYDPEIKEDVERAIQDAIRKYNGKEVKEEVEGKIKNRLIFPEDYLYGLGFWSLWDFFKNYVNPKIIIVQRTPRGIFNRS